MKQGVKLIDNSINQYQLGSILKEMFADNSFSQISIATGYWDLPEMVEIFDELKSFLERENTTFRLLPGEEPSVKAYQVINPETVDPNFPQKYLKKYLEDLELKPEYQKVIDLLTQNLEKTASGFSKVQIKVYKKNFLHAKCYIFGSETENAVGVIGSSNFTKQGLVGNLELNAVEDDGRIVNYQRLNTSQHPSHRSWFENIWNDSEDWNQQFNEEILGLSQFGNLSYSPYEVYIKILYELYGDDNINRLQKLITSRNLAFENRLRSFLKINDQQVNIDLLDILAIQSVHLVKDEAIIPQPDPVMWYGYYDKQIRD